VTTRSEQDAYTSPALCRCDTQKHDPCPFKQLKTSVLAIEGARVGLFCCSERCWALSKDSAEILGIPQFGSGYWHWTHGVGLLDVAKLATILHDVIRYGSFRTAKGRLRRHDGSDQWVFYYAEPIECNVSGLHSVLFHATPLTGEYGVPINPHRAPRHVETGPPVSPT
jgi:hypothetical protein